jgi:hypothetical protein
MNRIYVLWGRQSVGKTRTLNLIAREIERQFGVTSDPPLNPAINRDIHIVIAIGTLKIGITSAGDPGTNVAGRLNDLIGRGCAIIFCSSRTKGVSVTDVEAVEQAHNYRATWVTNYRTGFPNEEGFLNQRSATDLVQLMRTIANV